MRSALSRCFVEVRRQTRPTVCFVNAKISIWNGNPAPSVFLHKRHDISPAQAQV